MSNQPSFTSRHVAKPLFILTAAFSFALAGSVLANPTPTPTPTPLPVVKPKLRFSVDSRPERNLAAIDAAYNLRSPSNPANLIQETTTAHIIERVRAIQTKGATAGADDGKDVKETKEVAPPEGPVWEVYGDYSYLESQDNRHDGTDSNTHTATGGFDVTLNKTLLGLTYQWAHSGGSSADLDYHTTSNTNSVQIYGAQVLTDFLSVGVTGGYGHMEVDNFIKDPFLSTLTAYSNTNTYTTSPFVELSYNKDNFYTSLTTTYNYQHTSGNCADTLSFTAVAGYQVTSWFKAEVDGMFTQTLHNTQGGLPSDGYWFGVGPKFTEYITPRIYLYEAYQAKLNTNFSQHLVTGGVSISF